MNNLQIRVNAKISSITVEKVNDVFNYKVGIKTSIDNSKNFNSKEFVITKGFDGSWAKDFFDKVSGMINGINKVRVEM
jgi:hypothetical protein